MSSAEARGARDGVSTGEGGASSGQERNSPTGGPSGDLSSASIGGRSVAADESETQAIGVNARAANPVGAGPVRAKPDPGRSGSARTRDGVARGVAKVPGRKPSPGPTARAGTKPVPGPLDRTGRRSVPGPTEAAQPADPAEPATADAPGNAAEATEADGLTGGSTAGSAGPGPTNDDGDREDSGDGNDSGDSSDGNDSDNSDDSDDSDREDGDDSDSEDGDRKPAKIPGRDPLWARALVVLGTVLVLFASGSITAQKVLANRYDRALHRDVLIAPGARAGQDRHTALTGPLNYLLIGSDARDDSPEAGQRSDTAIILHIPATLDRAYLISIPRDLRVDIPPDPSIGYTGAHGVKINGAFQSGGGGRGGVQLLSATLNLLTGVSFDGAAVIDFAGFRKVVSLLGGVNMCVDERTESHHIGFDANGNLLPPWTGPEGSIRVRDSTPYVHEVGCRHMEPWQVLDYVRQRKSIPDGDFGRQRHQQQFLRAILDEAIRQGVARNPIRADAFIHAIGDSLTVDTNGMPLDELVYGLRNVNPSSLVGVRLPSVPQDISGYSYVLADEVLAPSLYAAIREDTLDNWVAANASWVNPL